MKLAPFLVRPSDELEQNTPYIKYFILCEGAKTERYYFEGLINQKKELGLPNTSKLLPNTFYVDKTEEDSHNSDPQNLLNVVLNDTELKQNEGIRPEDKFILVFDLDIFTAYREDTNHKNYGYNDLLAQAKGGAGVSNIYFAVTNPSFELFLLLHSENAWENIVQPKKVAILQNDSVSKKKRYISNIFSNVYGYNSKSNENVRDISVKVYTAIEEEKK